MRTTFPRVAVAMLAVAAVLLPSVPSAASTHGAIEHWLASERQSNGRPAVAACGDVQSYAQRRSEEMAAQQRIWHGEDLGSANGNWSAISEIVGRGSSTAAVTSAWSQSSTHRSKYLDARMTEVGVGAATGADGWVYSSIVLRAPSSPCASPRPLGAAAAPPPPPPPPPPRPAPAVRAPSAPAVPQPVPVQATSQGSPQPTLEVVDPPSMTPTLRSGLWITRELDEREGAGSSALEQASLMPSGGWRRS